MQAALLQLSVSIASSSHACLPFDAGRDTNRERDFSPPPHVWSKTTIPRKVPIHS